MPKKEQIPQQPQQPVAPQQNPQISDMQLKLNQMFDTRLQSELGAIRQAQAQAMQRYGNMKTQVKDNAFRSGNSADAVAQQNIKRLKDSMASQGLFRGGENITANTNLMAQRGSALANINRDRDLALNDIMERKNLASSQAQAQEDRVRNSIESERLQALINQMKHAEEFEYRQSRDGIADQRWNQQWEHGLSRDRIADDRWNQQWEHGLSRDRIADDRWNQQWEYGLERDRIGDDRWSQQFDFQRHVDNLNRQFQERQFNANQSNQQQQLNLQREKFEHSRTPQQQQNPNEAIASIVSTYKRHAEQGNGVNFLTQNAQPIIQEIGYKQYIELLERAKDQELAQQSEPKKRTLNPLTWFR